MTQPSFLLSLDDLIVLVEHATAAHAPVVRGGGFFLLFLLGLLGNVGCGSGSCSSTATTAGTLADLLETSRHDLVIGLLFELGDQLVKLSRFLGGQLDADRGQDLGYVIVGG